MAAEHQYFYEDEVYRINKKGYIEFGMVLENSELVSSDENSDNEDGVRMKKGHIRVAWHPSGVQEVIQEKKVGLADRSLMPGDVVRRLIKGKDTQRGYCRNIHVTACVQVVGTKQVVININSKDLVPIEDFTPDVAVCLDSWVGTIKSVRSKLHLVFADNSKCIISDVQACAFEELDERRISDYESPHRNDYYPGQVLYGPIEALDEGVWTNCSKEVKALKLKRPRNVKVVVEKVETDSVTVQWQCHAYSPNGSCDLKEQPNYTVQGEDLKKLKLLDVFEPCTLQIGDRVYYTFKENDVQMTKDQWRTQQKEIMMQKSPYLSKFNVKNKVISKGNYESKGVNEEVVNTSPTVDNGHVEEPDDKQNDHQQKSHESGPGEDWETDEYASQDDTASVSSGCSSNSSSAGGGNNGNITSAGRKKKGPTLMTKVLKFKKLRRARRKTPNVLLKPNQRVIVETLAITSTADVVWQDGTVEENIPSIELYPIHHLDDQEFFPGDFVMENKEDGCLRVYGVIQSVDHAGRIAVVNWFHTYTSSDDPNPTKLEQSEVSVYDLKDHPDFQYRPGTVTIRVANFEGEDATCTAGQVLDNYPEGRVYVWWVDGHVSMCWPQDLYKVGDYDSDEGELWDDGSSEGSWETESEGSSVAEEEAIDQNINTKLAANIEKARIAMSRLEELFTQNPALQTLDIMKKLLEVYKDCRYLDKLMGTSFFHENNFRGLLERVRERGRAGVGAKVAEQVSRLFQNTNETPSKISSLRDSEKLIVTYDFENEGLKSFVDEENRTVPPPITTVCLAEENKTFNCNLLPEETKDHDDVNEQNKILVNNELNNEKTKSFDINGEISHEIERVNKTLDSLSDTLDKKILEQNSRNLDKLEINNLQILKTKSKLGDDKLDGIFKSGNSEDECSNSTEKSPGSANGQLIQSSSADDSGVFEHSTASADTTSFIDNCDCFKPQSNNVKTIEATEENTTEKLLPDIKKGTYIFGAMGTRSLHVQSDKRTGGKIKYQTPNSLTVFTGDKEVLYDASSNDCNASQVCAKLCALIKSQLVKAHAEVTRRFQGDKAVKTLSEVDSETVAPPGEENPSGIKLEASEITEEKTETKSNEEVAVEPKEETIRNSSEGFSIMSNAPNSHKYKLSMCQITDYSLFFKAIKKELTLLRSALPPGIWVKGFEDRTDLYSVMIRGPEKTPYEDGLFVFDFQLPSDYPRVPPLCHYLSYCSDRLNPNLYEDGKVCISLLGTWSGKGTEVWTLNSNLLQVVVSFQGLILVNEPYFNEANYEKQKGSQQGQENSRMYNEMAILKLVQAMTKMYIHPPEVFVDEIKQHFAQNADRFVNRLTKWLDISERYHLEVSKNSCDTNKGSETQPDSDGCDSNISEIKNENKDSQSNDPTNVCNLEWEKSPVNLSTIADQPEFPLLPASRGFCLTLRKTLAAFRNIIDTQSS